MNRDLVLQIRGLLEHARLPQAGLEGQFRSVVPSDIAVLVRTGIEARSAQKALIDQGIPAVLARSESVLRSEAAEQWRWLLWAVERPSDPRRARTLALSWFGGWSAQEVGEADDAAFSKLQEQIMGWGETLTRQGVASFVRQVWNESGLTARILARQEGDRAMTDLQHVGELLQAAPPSVRSSVAGLLSVLETEPLTDPDTEEHGDVTARRIESEANAVQIMTVWVAKGLEFESVCVPTLWRAPKLWSVIYQNANGQRTLDVTENKGRAVAKRRVDGARREALGEQLRLLYVALTRAKHHTILWWSHIQSSESSALAHVLFAHDEGLLDQAAFDELRATIPADEYTYDELQPLLALSAGSIVASVHGSGVAPSSRWDAGDTERAAPLLELAALTTLPDRSRQRWSFTALTSSGMNGDVDPYDASLSDGGAADEAGDGASEFDNEPEVAAGSYPAMALLPAGTAFGTLVHTVLEEVDFTAEPLPDALAIELNRQLRKSDVDLTPVTGDSGLTGRDLLVSALTSVIGSPMTPTLRLRDLGRGERINEMSFELGLGGGGEQATMRQLAQLLATHLPDADPFAPWAKRLAAQKHTIALAGHLTGSIDLIFRSAESGSQRFYVADYKTNRLSKRGQPPHPDDYDDGHMIEAMVEHHYPLQALLYMVALHRYLRWRLPDYNPNEHLGGSVYLFVRGMTGDEPDPSTGQPRGVLAWRPPSGLVVAVSDLLHGMGATA